MLERRAIRLSRELYVGSAWFFVTICCHERQTVLADGDKASRVENRLRTVAQAQDFLVHAWCIMPDHVHMLVKGASEGSNLLHFVVSFKQVTALDISREIGIRLWQRSFYDHRLRRDDEISKVAAYIWMNPVRRGLCNEPAAYQFSGSFTCPWKRYVTVRNAWVPPWKKAIGRA